ncbi:hypothetical protein CERSUDRAFT_87571 [Gelatoporia subvermispora B]|uniref:Uncharacterized protein n=1 Tax=Ceriporiopsis subvermispora (strain B) TaxID=914234 RepID=M2PC58_CERS8|nr:hypothetical protein CERSUDRAFT_87571 [Gelatoporia subvermispora B]
MVFVTPWFGPTATLWPGGYYTPHGMGAPLPPSPIRRSSSAPHEPTFRHDEAKHFDKIDKFAGGPNYGPVLEPLVLKKLNVKPDINPLLGPQKEGSPHLTWNMLFPTAQCQRSDEDPRTSWREGRDAPATWPRVMRLQIVSKAFPWVFDIHAFNSATGVTCGDLLDRIHLCLQERVSQAQLDSAPAELKGVMGEAYRYNRSPEPDVPGGRLPNTMLRCDWLAFDTTFGGIVRNDKLAKERGGTQARVTFELLCLARAPDAAATARRRRRGLSQSSARVPRGQARPRAASREAVLPDQPSPVDVPTINVEDTTVPTPPTAPPPLSRSTSQYPQTTKVHVPETEAQALAQIEGILQQMRQRLLPDVNRFVAHMDTAQSTGRPPTELVVNDHNRLSGLLDETLAQLDAVPVKRSEVQKWREAREVRRSAIREVQELMSKFDRAWSSAA